MGLNQSKKQKIRIHKSITQNEIHTLSTKDLKYIHKILKPNLSTDTLIIPDNTLFDIYMTPKEIDQIFRKTCEELENR